MALHLNPCYNHLNKCFIGMALSILLFSCNENMNKESSIKTARTIPIDYINVADNNFSNHQDTIYSKQIKFSGFIYSLNTNSDTEFIKSYYNGLEEGCQKKWHLNNQLAENRMYIDGKKEGLQQAWWPNGKHKFMYTATHDIFMGELKEWNSTGLLNKDFNYINGQEEGSEKMWWDDGTIRANYVIRNGKRYGLLGMKICINPYDSVIVKRKT